MVLIYVSNPRDKNRLVFFFFPRNGTFKKHNHPGDCRQVWDRIDVWLAEPLNGVDDITFIPSGVFPSVLRRSAVASPGSSTSRGHWPIRTQSHHVPRRPVTGPQLVSLCTQQSMWFQGVRSHRPSNAAFRTSQTTVPAVSVYTKQSQNHPVSMTFPTLYVRSEDRGRVPALRPCQQSARAGEDSDCIPEVGPSGARWTRSSGHCLCS